MVVHFYGAFCCVWAEHKTPHGVPWQMALLPTLNFKVYCTLFGPTTTTNIKLANLSVSIKFAMCLREWQNSGHGLSGNHRWWWSILALQCGWKWGIKRDIISSYCCVPIPLLWLTMYMCWWTEHRRRNDRYLRGVINLTKMAKAINCPAVKWGIGLPLLLVQDPNAGGDTTWGTPGLTVALN